MTADLQSPLLEMRNISKDYGGVRVLRGVHFDLRAGEVHALCGENGAGKSTLIKILSGAVRRNTGEILLRGRPVSISRPHDAQGLGISVIYQEFNLVPTLSAEENVFLGRFPRRLGLVKFRDMRERAAALFRSLNLDVPLGVPLSRFSVAQQQMVEIAKALAEARESILVLDEPSAVLTPPEIARLFEIINDLKKRGVGLIYVSHRLEEIFQIADRVTVLKDGARVATVPAQGLGRDDLVKMMVGRPLEKHERPTTQFKREPALEVRDLRVGKEVKGVSFKLMKGEILGVAGLVGAGRTAMARAIFGADRPDGGEVLLFGRRADIRSPKQAQRRGLALVPEDRKTQGLLLPLPLRWNVSLANMRKFSRLGIINAHREDTVARDYQLGLRVRARDRSQPCIELSGGNQQKILLARWLNTDPKVLILDEPTRGVDVGVKQQIYDIMADLAAKGIAILMISSDLPEILRMSDRILVMREGRITAEFDDPSKTSEEEILSYASR